MVNIFKKMIFHLILLFIFNILIGEILEIKITDLTNLKYFTPPLMMQDLTKSAPNTIGIFFIGSSRCERGYNPAIINPIINKQSFNIASPGQTPITSYFLLKQVLQEQQPEYIFYDLALEALMSDHFTTAAYIFDLLPWNRNKIQFLFHGFNFPEQIFFILPLYRFRNNFGYIIKYKLLGRKYNNPDEIQYNNYGFSCSSRTYRLDKSEKPNWSFQESEINKKNIVYLRKIKKLCECKNTKLVFLMTPNSNAIDTNFYNKAHFINFSSKLASDLNSHLYYFSANEIGLIDTVHFQNSNHLNCLGAAKYSEFVAERIKM